MLHIYYGDPDWENYIYNPKACFDNTYEDSWITDPMTKRMVRDVDKSEVIGPGLIESPFLGPIPPERLSGGVRTLILMNFDSSHVFNASACGNNCAKWILEIAKEKDLTIRLGYLMDFGSNPGEIEIVNLKRIVHTTQELDEAVLDNRLI